MPEPTQLFPRRRTRRSITTALVVAASVLVLLFTVDYAVDHREPAHPEWAVVTRALESDAWPLVRAARYDPANHFVLVDIGHGVAPHVAVRLACEDILDLVDGVDSTAGFALYAAPDRVVAHRDDCADGKAADRRAT